MNRCKQLLVRYPVFWLAAGLAGVTELIFTVEWSFAGCSELEDGPFVAVYGFPFPYLRWGGASSFEYSFVPALYVANVVLRAVVWFFALRPLVRRLAPISAQARRSSISVAGGLLCAVFVIVNGLLLSVGVRNPVWSLRPSGWESYSELRPVGLGTSLPYLCTPLSNSS
ncbi:MAG: hypothetical protein KUG77_02980 [Nannocystaceae bacterium]|nr:hypothetical protein [Nannocystaceae bacterium]